MLTVAVDATITLLEHHQRPRQVEVDQPVAEVVQIQALGGDVRAQQDAYRILAATETFDQGLLLGITKPAVQYGDLIGF